MTAEAKIYKLWQKYSTAFIEDSGYRVIYRKEFLKALEEFYLYIKEQQ